MGLMADGCVQWPGFEHEERMSSGSPGTAILRLSIAAETRNFLWNIYKKMAVRESRLPRAHNAEHASHRIPKCRRT